MSMRKPRLLNWKNGDESKLPINPDRFLSLTLLPCGAIKDAELRELARALTGKGMLVTIVNARPVPPEAFEPRRQQYRADDFLDVARNERGDQVLVLTNCDLYADDLNFVFGVADLPGKCAVISLFRLRLGADEETFRRRAVKEAVHEIGHTLGLPHCVTQRCVMRFSNSLGETDDKGTDLCDGCKKKIERDRGPVPLAHDYGG
jgi:archaemetzincin